MRKENPHEGCCNRHSCNHDLGNCCYISRRECINDKPDFINLQK